MPSETSPTSFFAGPVFDAHLDLAMNVQRGRDVRLPANDQPLDRGMIATVGLPDLRRGNVTHFCATIFCLPAIADRPGYRNPEEAFAQASEQIATYHAWAEQGLIALPTSWHGRPARDSSENTGEAPVPQNTDPTPNVLILLEGAECIRTPDDLPFFYDAGVRLVGLAWQATRYAGGTSTPGPLTDAGRELVRELDSLGFIHDASHLAERSFWDLLDVTANPVVASHSNCRAIVGEDPGERHLTDDMIRALAQRDGVIGINIYDKILLPHDQHGKRRATIADVVAHVRHVCDVVGDAKHVAIGTDMDGGLGREQIPIEIKTSSDLHLIGDALLAAGFDAAAARDIMFNNWHDRLIARAPQRGPQ